MPLEIIIKIHSRAKLVRYIYILDQSIIYVTNNQTCAQGSLYFA